MHFCSIRHSLEISTPYSAILKPQRAEGVIKRESSSRRPWFPRHWHTLHVTARVSCLVFLPGQCWVSVGTFCFSVAKGQDILTSIPGFWLSSCRPRVTIWLWMHTVGLHCWKAGWLGLVNQWLRYVLL